MTEIIFALAKNVLQVYAKENHWLSGDVAFALAMQLLGIEKVYQGKYRRSNHICP